MPLSASTRHELRSELERLTRLRADIDTQIKALEALLGRKEATPYVSVGGVVTVIDPVMMPDGGGLRDRIRTVLTAPEGMKAGRIADAVVASGYTSEGKTDVRTRVYNELYRMKKLKLVRRTTGGKFVLAPESNENGQ